jgi:hypothetical protein
MNKAVKKIGNRQDYEALKAEQEAQKKQRVDNWHLRQEYKAICKGR